MLGKIFAKGVKEALRYFQGPGGRKELAKGAERVMTKAAREAAKRVRPR